MRINDDFDSLLDYNEEDICPDCGGSGFIWFDLYDGSSKQFDCEKCHSTGYLDWVDKMVLGIK